MFSALYALVVALDPGTIEKPTNGSVIGPNSVFDFKYWIRADYSVSSYAFSVWLMTEMPGSFSPSEVWSTGHYFGRFDEANYPAVPYATNPAPPNLTMPNFAVSEIGHSSGVVVQNGTYYFSVIEEWDDGAGAAGRKISLAYNTIVYNGTYTD